MNGTQLKPSTTLLLTKVLMIYHVDNKFLSEISLKCTKTGNNLPSNSNFKEPQSLWPNVKLKTVVMPSLPDTKKLTENSSKLNFKNKKPLVITQWPKLLVILLWNKDTVTESSLKTEITSLMKTKKLTLSLIMVLLSLKLQSSLLKCKPPTEETPLTWELPLYPLTPVPSSLKKKDLEMMKLITLTKLLDSLLLLQLISLN